MPLYEYHCVDCGYQFEMLRPMNDADKPVACGKCKRENVRRSISLFCAHSDGKAVAGGNSGCGSCSGGNCGQCNH